MSAPPFAQLMAQASSHMIGEETNGGCPPSAGTIYLYHADLRQTAWRNFADMLSADERRRAAAFVHERDLRRFIVSHAVLRTLLSYATEIPPGELSFRQERGLKPVLETPTARPIHFSLSRSQELVIIGLACRPLGVDIEWLGRTLDTEALSNLALSNREREALRCVDPSDRQRAFLQCWTQKEAYLKAIGQGLYVAPAAVEVLIGPATTPGLKSIADDWIAGVQWFVDLVVPREGYIGALAISGRRWRVKMTAFDTSSLLDCTWCGAEPI
jgi:4'-phosphopantetheinyl transferase